jgi:hypothetical protein
MTKSSKSLGSRSDELLEKLLAAIGKGDTDNFDRHALVQRLREIEAGFQLPNIGPYRKLLRKYRENTAKRGELWRQLGPIHDEIVMAGLVRKNPGVDEGDLRAALQDHTKDFDLPEIEANEDEDIAFLIDRADDYRKRQVRKQAVEPFLRFLQKHDVVPSRKLPLNRMMAALFDWLHIEMRLRPTETGVRTIARDLKLSLRPTV